MADAQRSADLARGDRPGRAGGPANGDAAPQPRGRRAADRRCGRVHRRHATRQGPRARADGAGRHQIGMTRSSGVTDRRPSATPSQDCYRRGRGHHHRRPDHRRRHRRQRDRLPPGAAWGVGDPDRVELPGLWRDRSQPRLHLGPHPSARPRTRARDAPPSRARRVAGGARRRLRPPHGRWPALRAHRGPAGNAPGLRGETPGGRRRHPDARRR